MTIREYLNKRQKRNSRIFMFGLYVFAFGALFSFVSEAMGVFWLGPTTAFLGMAAVLIAMILNARMRCPLCTCDFGGITWTTINAFKPALPKEVKYCPCCGIELDKDLNTL